MYQFVMQTLQKQNELGWTAKRGIEEMCRDSWRWQKKNTNGYDSID
jgi:UDP-glucose 4-epimerase